MMQPNLNLNNYFSNMMSAINERALANKKIEMEETLLDIRIKYRELIKLSEQKKRATEDTISDIRGKCRELISSCDTFDRLDYDIQLGCEGESCTQ